MEWNKTRKRGDADGIMYETCGTSRAAAQNIDVGTVIGGSNLLWTRVGALRGLSHFAMHPNKIINCVNEYQRYHYSKSRKDRNAPTMVLGSCCELVWNSYRQAEG
jgi:hypothetical protein